MEHRRTNIIQQDTSILAQVKITDLPQSPYRPDVGDFLKQCQIPEEYRMTLMLYHQQCLQVTEHRKRLEKRFKVLLRLTPAAQFLMSLPGIGDITGSIIAMETDNIQRFADYKHYCSSDPDGLLNWDSLLYRHSVPKISALYW